MCAGKCFSGKLALYRGLLCFFAELEGKSLLERALL